MFNKQHAEASPEVAIKRAISERLCLAIQEDNFSQYCPGYQFHSHSKVTEFARNHSFLSEVINLIGEFNQPYVRREITMIFLRFKNDGIVTRPKCRLNVYSRSVYDKLFEKAIKKKILSKKSQPIHSNAVHGWSELDCKIKSYLVKQSSRGNTKFSDMEKDQAVAFLAHHMNQWQRLNYREVRELLLRNGFKMSLSTLKSWNRKNNNNEIDLRNGRTEFNRKIIPPYKFIKPSNVYERWEIDGFRVNKPFAYFNKFNERKNGFLTCFIVLDVYSKHIVGMSIGSVENHSLVMEAIEDAIQNFGFLPRKIIGDRSSAYKHPNFKTLTEKLLEFGCTFTKVPTSESKGTIESVFNIIQSSFIKHIPGNLGLGIKTKKSDSRLSDEEAYRTFLVPEQWSENETKSAIVESLLHYVYYKGFIGKSPYETFTSSAPDTPRINDEHIAQLFWPCKERKVIRSQVSLKINGCEYVFTIDDEKFWKELTGRKVIVRFNAKDLSKVYLFDDERFITTASRDIEIIKELVEEDKTMELIPQDQSEFYERRSHQIRKFHAIHNAQKKSNADKISEVFGDEVLLGNWLDSDKERTTLVRDSQLRQHYMEKFGLTSQDERAQGNSKSKIKRIETTKELEQVEIPQNKTDKIIDRWYLNS